MTKKGFLSTGEHIDDVMSRIYENIDNILAHEIKNLSQEERTNIFKDISIVFKEAAIFG